MNVPRVSLFASAIRPHLWQKFLDSMKGTTIPVEIVFAGPVPPPQDLKTNDVNIRFVHILTNNIKPAQVYEVARRACTGELIGWTADDAEYPNDILAKVHDFYRVFCTPKDIVSIRTRENYNGTWRDCDASSHRFYGGPPEGPKMAPMGIMSRAFLDILGGIDRRYFCGQWDNDIVMRLTQAGGNVIHFSECWIELDHANKHDPKYGTSFARPFGQAYYEDRKVLEGTWGTREQIKSARHPDYKRYDGGFEPFEGKDLKLSTQSNTMRDLWES